MTVRVFKCHDCGHRMRLAGDSCGRCHTRKLWYQRTDLYLGIAAVVALGAVFVGMTLA